MDTLSDIDPLEKIPLETAWDVYADLAVPGMEYRKKLRRLIRAADDETLAETERREFEYNKLERSLKRQFIIYIENGAFEAFGCDITNSATSNDIGPIHRSLFDPRLNGFQVHWDENRMEVLDRQITGIEVRPHIQRLRATWPEKYRSAAQPDQVQALEVDTESPFPKPAGATSYEDVRREAILVCYKRYDRFANWKLPRRLEEFRKAVLEIDPEFDTRRGLSKSSFYDTVNYLKETGALPSNNVQ